MNSAWSGQRGAPHFGTLTVSGRWVVTVFALTALIATGCDSRPDAMLSRLLRTEDPPVSAEEAPSGTIEELEEDIRTYQDEVNARFRSSRNLASAHRMLAMRYLESGMYGPALEHFQSAADILSGNATIYYYAGVAAANLARGTLEPELATERYEIAERAYLRALELRDRYPSAAYGLAILYAYELDRPEAARQQIDRVLEWRSRDPRARAVSAYVYAALGRVDEAIAEYDSVIDLSDDESFRNEAREMQQQLRQGGNQ